MQDTNNSNNELFYSDPSVFPNRILNPNSKLSSNDTLSNNNPIFTNDYVSSKRCIYTPSSFARTSLLYLQECGYLTAIRPHISSRANLQSYLFFVVKSGEGWLEYKNEHYELKAGDCAFIDCKHGYAQSSSETLWSLSWAHFNSSSMPAIWNKYTERGGRAVFHLGDSSLYISLLEELYTTASSSSYIRDVEINTRLTELIGLLFAETVYEEGEQPTVVNAGVDRIDVSQIKSYIDTHYKDQLTLQFLADRYYFQKSYLARTFKERFGVTVNGYIGVVRISKAKELLRFTEMSVESIGAECGYNDQNYFSRTFKKVEGCSPSEFRKNWKNNGKE